MEVNSMKKVVACILLTVCLVSCSAINRMLIPYEEDQACRLKGKNGLCGSMSDVYDYTTNVDFKKFKESRRDVQ
jgi:hypothetical protein